MTSSLLEVLACSSEAAGRGHGSRQEEEAGGALGRAGGGAGGSSAHQWSFCQALAEDGIGRIPGK